jgi:hypothetical protein
MQQLDVKCIFIINEHFLSSLLYYFGMEARNFWHGCAHVNQ